MTLVIVGGSAEPDLEEAKGVFVEAGFQVADEVTGWDEADGILILHGDGARTLSDADAAGVRYVLVHVGRDDGEPEGSHDRAHHRVDPDRLSDLARELRSRERMLVTCMAFAYKKGIPDGAAWVVDVRLIDNPYWVDELRPLDGRDPRVSDFVLRQPAAVELLDNLERTLRAAFPHYRERGRWRLTVAFGCTGGRHRSVAMAREMTRRLRDMEGMDVEFAARDLE